MAVAVAAGALEVAATDGSSAGTFTVMQPDNIAVNAKPVVVTASVLSTLVNFMAPLDFP